MQNASKNTDTINTQKKKPFVKPRLVEHWHLISFFLFVYDIIAVNAAYFLALWVRFDCQYSEIPWMYLSSWLYFIPIYSVVVLLSFQFTKLYQSIWRFASYHEFARVTQVTAFTTIVHALRRQRNNRSYAPFAVGSWRLSLSTPTAMHQLSRMHSPTVWSALAAHTWRTRDIPGMWPLCAAAYAALVLKNPCRRCSCFA